MWKIHRDRERAAGVKGGQGQEGGRERGLESKRGSREMMVIGEGFRLKDFWVHSELPSHHYLTQSRDVAEVKSADSQRIHFFYWGGGTYRKI